MEAIKKLENTLNKFKAVKDSYTGIRKEEDSDSDESAWITFRLEKSEQGWRTLEYLSWIFTDMVNARYPVRLAPYSPPPFANTPGQCLRFAIDCFPDGYELEEILNITNDFIDDMHDMYWNKVLP